MKQLHSKISTLKRIQAKATALNASHVDDTIMIDVTNHVRKLSRWLQSCLSQCDCYSLRMPRKQIEYSNQFISEF